MKSWIRKFFAGYLILQLTTAIAWGGGNACAAPISKTDLRTGDNIIWYRQPAEDWVEALPVGNGRLGAMVFGKVQMERIQLNDDSIFAGKRTNRNNPEALESLAEVRRLLFAGKPAEAQAEGSVYQGARGKPGPFAKCLGLENYCYVGK